MFIKTMNRFSFMILLVSALFLVGYAEGASAYSVSGAVKDASGGQLIAGATVTVRPTDASPDIIATTAGTADASGNNFTANLGSAGEYVIFSVSKTGYEDAFPPLFPFTVSETSPNFVYDSSDNAIYLTYGQTSQVQLLAGWNLISLPMQPTNTALSNVISGMADKYDIIWGDYDDTTGSWKYMKPAGFIPAGSKLTAMQAARAYWFKATQAGSLIISGSTPSATITLTKGWNFVGFNKGSAMTVADAISTIADKYDIIWGDYDDATGSWKYVKPTGFIPAGSKLSNMSPGKGYWIKINSAYDNVNW
jgi:hypothetical protein